MCVGLIMDEQETKKRLVFSLFPLDSGRGVGGMTIDTSSVFLAKETI